MTQTKKRIQPTGPLRSKSCINGNLVALAAIVVFVVLACLWAAQLKEYDREQQAETFKANLRQKLNFTRVGMSLEDVIEESRSRREKLTFEERQFIDRMSPVELELFLEKAPGR